MPKPRMITDDEDFPIKPADIKSDDLGDPFGDQETNFSAAYIVRFMQESGGWVPFTYAQVNAFFQETEGHVGVFPFRHLLGYFTVWTDQYKSHQDRLDVVVRDASENAESWGNVKDTDVFRVTDEFVLRCYRSAGIPRMKPTAQPIG